MSQPQFRDAALCSCNTCNRRRALSGPQRRAVHPLIASHCREASGGRNSWLATTDMLTVNLSEPFAGTCSRDSAARFEGHALSSSSNKAGASGCRVVRVVRMQAGNKVASACETQVTVLATLLSISDVFFFWGFSEVQARSGVIVRCELVGRAHWQPTNTREKSCFLFVSHLVSMQMSLKGVMSTQVRGTVALELV